MFYIFIRLAWNTHLVLTAGEKDQLPWVSRVSALPPSFLHVFNSEGHLCFHPGVSGTEWLKTPVSSKSVCLGLITQDTRH